MYYPATRLLTILELLQTYPVLSGKDLANRMEVDTRTVRRYITMLQDMGMPIEAERGRYGGYRLYPGYKLPPLMFQEGEAMALTLGLLLTKRLGIGQATPDAETALIKIERVLPIPIREQVQAIQNALTLELRIPDVDGPTSNLIIDLCLAVYQAKRVGIQYESWAGSTTKRKYDPYGIVCRHGLWYTAGYCHLRKDLRTFRLDRVEAATILDQSFTPPSSFDIVAHVEQALAKTPGVWFVQVRLLTSLDEAKQMVPPALATLEEQNDQVLLSCHIQNLDWFAYVMLDFECEMEIISPPALHDALRKIAAKIARLTIER